MRIITLRAPEERALQSCFAGRILNSLFLIEQGLLTLPILYLSRTIIRHKRDYYRLLFAVTGEAAWEEWLLFVIEGVAPTALWTTAKIAAIRALSTHTRNYGRETASGIDSHELIDLIFERLPVASATSKRRASPSVRPRRATSNNSWLPQCWKSSLWAKRNFSCIPNSCNCCYAKPTTSRPTRQFEAPPASSEFTPFARKI